MACLRTAGSIQCNPPERRREEANRQVAKSAKRRRERDKKKVINGDARGTDAVIGHTDAIPDTFFSSFLLLALSAPWRFAPSRRLSVDRPVCYAGSAANVPCPRRPTAP
jgi:hypothetical protein